MSKKFITLCAIAFAVNTISYVSAAKNVYVNPNYSINSAARHSFGKDAFQTVQEAVTAVDQNGTIYISPGTYHENLVIEKSLTLLGLGKNVTLGSSNNSPTIEGGNATNTATITINGKATPIDVTIRNLTINNGGNGINVLQNANVTINKNSVKGYYKNGITFGPVLSPGFGGVSGIISNNIVIGKGPTNTVSQNGIQISENNTAVIINNKIANHIYTIPDSWWASGVLIHRSEKNSITHNTFDNNQAGIDVMQGSNNTITQNNINNNASSNAGITIGNSDDQRHPATANSVIHNTINGGLVGIWTTYASGNTYSRNIITNTSQNGIYSWDSNKNTFVGNIISQTSSSSRLGYGIVLNGGDTKQKIVGSNNNILSDNIVRDVSTLFYMNRNSEKNIFSNNNFNAANTISGKDNDLTLVTKKILDGQGMVLGDSMITFLRDMQSGDTGNDVLYLQKILQNYGNKNLTTSGYFDEETRIALKAWQIKNNLLGTGKLDTPTRTFINTVH